jgi:hypothetical protein
MIYHLQLGISTTQTRWSTSYNGNVIFGRHLSLIKLTVGWLVYRWSLNNAQPQAQRYCISEAGLYDEGNLVPQALFTTPTRAVRISLSSLASLASLSVRS